VTNRSSKVLETNSRLLGGGAAGPLLLGEEATESMLIAAAEASLFVGL